MSYELIYSKEAITELNRGFIWYRSKELDLGQRFKDAFNKIRIQLRENPEIFKEVGINNHRRAIMGSSFPYTIHYLVNEKAQAVTIIGVFHQSKHIDFVKEQTRLERLQNIVDKKVLSQSRLKNLDHTKNSKDIARDRGLEL